ncbi:MAG: rod shape-determining protein RodA [Bacteroidales bacterium]|nr:rod shape-determining protein RodA [Bacteroidales bacterium]
MRRNTNIISNLDWLTIAMFVMLVFIGWINIYSAVYSEEHKNIFDFSQRYGKQIIWIMAAGLIAVILLLLDSGIYSLFAYGIYAFMIFLLMAVLVLGKEVNASRSWFEIGSVRLQPAEFAKFATLLALSKLISDTGFSFNNIKSLSRLALILFLPVGLILLQGDAGSALVYYIFVLVLYREGLSHVAFFLAISIPVLFISTLIFEKVNVFIPIVSIAFLFVWLMSGWKKLLTALGIYIGSTAIFLSLNEIRLIDMDLYYILLLALAPSSLVYFILQYRYKLRNLFLLHSILLGIILYTFSINYMYSNILKEHQRLRIDVLLGKEKDPHGVGYNVEQSLIAIGSGGVSGKGFLQGTQTKLNYVPEQDTDFIFCTVGEEWGFIGTTFVILFFIAFLLRLIFLAERQRSQFSRIYGYGVVSILFLHILINIGMTIGLAPVIGIPLPFFSYGGSSLWAFTILIFIFLRLDASRMEMLK